MNTYEKQGVGGQLLLTTYLTTSEDQAAGRCSVWRLMTWRAASGDILGLPLRAGCALG
jgi:hypothetical protein